MRRSASAGRRGFTLIEVVVALTIMAIGAAVAIPAFLSLVREDDLTSATRTVERLFRIARDSAIHGGTPVTVVMDSATGYVWLDTPPLVGGEVWASEWEENLSLFGSTSFLPPDDVSLETFGTILPIPAGVRLEISKARARFTFSPSGQAFADSLVLASVLGRRTVTLDSWTGDVVVR